MGHRTRAPCSNPPKADTEAVESPVQTAPPTPGNAALAEQAKVTPTSDTPLIDGLLSDEGGAAGAPSTAGRATTNAVSTKWDDDENEGTLKSTQTSGMTTNTTQVKVGSGITASHTVSDADRNPNDAPRSGASTTVSGKLGDGKASVTAGRTVTTVDSPESTNQVGGTATLGTDGVTLAGKATHATPGTTESNNGVGSVTIGSQGVSKISTGFSLGEKDEKTELQSLGFGVSADVAKGTTTVNGNLFNAKGSLTTGEDGWNASAGYGKKFEVSGGRETNDDGTTTTSGGLSLDKVPTVKKIGVEGSVTEGNGTTKVSGAASVNDYGVNGSYSTTDRAAETDEEGALSSSHETGSGWSAGAKGKVHDTQLNASYGRSSSAKIGLSDTVPAGLTDDARKNYQGALEKKRVRAESEGVDVSALEAGSGMVQSVTSGDEWGAGAEMYVAEIGGTTNNQRTVTRSLQRQQDGTFAAGFTRQDARVDGETGSFAGFGGSNAATDDASTSATFSIDPSQPTGMRDAQAFADLGVLPGALPTAPAAGSAAERIVTALAELADRRTRMAELDPNTPRDAGLYRVYVKERQALIAGAAKDVCAVNAAYEAELSSVHPERQPLLPAPPNQEPSSASRVTSLVEGSASTEKNTVKTPFHSDTRVDRASADQTTRDVEANATTKSGARRDTKRGADLQYAATNATGGSDRLAFSSVDPLGEKEPTEALEGRKGIGPAAVGQVGARVELDVDRFEEAGATGAADPAWQRMTASILGWWRHPETAAWLALNQPGALPAGQTAVSVPALLQYVRSAQTFEALAPWLQDLYYKTLLWKDDERETKRNDAFTENEDVFDALLPISQLPDARRQAALAEMMEAAAASGNVTRRWAEASKRLPPALSEVLDESTAYFEPEPAAADAVKLDTKKRAALLAGLDLNPSAGAKVIEVLTAARLAGGAAEVDAVIAAGEHPVTDLWQCVMNNRDQRHELYRLIDGTRAEALLEQATSKGGALHAKASQIFHDGLYNDPERSTQEAELDVKHLPEAEVAKASADLKGWSGDPGANRAAILTRLEGLKARGATPAQLDKVMAGCGVPEDWARKLICVPAYAKERGRLFHALDGTRFASDLGHAERAILALQQPYRGIHDVP